MVAADSDRVEVEAEEDGGCVESDGGWGSQEG